ncbi:MAG: MFS transporter [Bacillota bacterium]
MTQLIIFRGLQGLGAGSMMAIAIAIIGDIFPPAQRGRYQGMMGGVFGISSVIGPSLGGYLTDQLNWRWVFFVNLPVAIIAIGILAASMPRVRVTIRRAVDYLGVSTLLLATVPMLLAFSWAGTEYAWGSAQIITLLGVSAVSLVLFILVERRAQEPILPMDLFKNSIFTVSNLVVFFTGAAMFGSIMFIPLFMQGVIGLSATNSGMLLTPMMLSIVAGSVISGQLMTRTGKYKWLTVFAIALMALGMLLFSQMNESTTHAQVIRDMIIVGIGLGVTFPVFMITVQNSVPYSQLGVVSAAVQFFRSIGGTIGVAVFGTFLSLKMQHEIKSIIPPQVRQMLPADQLKTISDPQALFNPDTLSKIKSSLPPDVAPLFEKIISGFRHALVVSIHDVFLASFVAVLVSLVIVFFLKEIPLRSTHDHQEQKASPIDVALTAE